MSKRTDAATRKAVMRGWDARSNSPSESIDNICEAVEALVRRAQAGAWDSGYMSATDDEVAGTYCDNPYRGRGKR